MVEPSNKRILIALDISGSMASKLLDSPIEVREAATLMAMLTFRVWRRDSVGVNVCVCARACRFFLKVVVVAILFLMSTTRKDFL